MKIPEIYQYQIRFRKNEKFEIYLIFNKIYI